MSNVLRKLDASERPRALYEATFTGKGDFPYDMLRFDGCWPATPDDVSRLATYRFMRPEPAKQEQREVTLHSHRDFTPDRWASFGWYEVQE